MKKYFKKFNIKNKGPALYRRHKPSGAGFVLLFAVTLASILLAIALGVAQVAYKEIRFGTSAKDTGDAFFAADTGIEYALYQDKPPGSPYTVSDGEIQYYQRTPYNLASTTQACAKVTITKDKTNPPSIITNIVSKGYNLGSDTTPVCNSTSQNLIERELDINY